MIVKKLLSAFCIFYVALQALGRPQEFEMLSPDLLLKMHCHSELDIDAHYCNIERHGEALGQLHFFRENRAPACFNFGAQGGDIHRNKVNPYKFFASNNKTLSLLGYDRCQDFNLTALSLSR